MVLHDQDRPVDDVVDVDLALLGDRLPGKIEQALDDLPAAFRFPDNDLEVLFQFGVAGRSLEKKATVGQHAGERVVQFMSDSGGQTSE